jgi:hypothetical protein
MISRYPGHDPEASLQQLRWRGLDRFDCVDVEIPLGPRAKELAALPPDPRIAPYAQPAPVRGATRLGLATACGPNAAAKAARAQTVAVPAGIGDFPKKKYRARRPAVQRRDKASCPHDQGWQSNGKGTSPGKAREQCRACGLNRSVAAGTD